MAAEKGPKLLVIDDEAGILDMLSIVFGKDGYRVAAAKTCKDGLAKLESELPDLVLTDLKMPDGSGFDVLSRSRELSPSTPVVMITAFTSTKTAIEALKQGAYDYISKPFDIEELKHVVGRALERKRLAEENVFLKEKVARSAYGAVVGVSRRMKAVFDLVDRIGKTTSTVLLSGESGTGKELIARAIHQASARVARPFVSINCGAMPETLLESELFGHERGAFTGAVREKKGLFQEAEGGTLLLDEIGEMSLTMQVKLLRALQERVVRRVGGNVEEPVDVRIICATNKDLAKKVADTSFREDLFYRINVIPLQIPPLRERRDDIPYLVRHFLKKVVQDQGIAPKKISTEAMRLLESYPWPGNVRELENLIERTVALEPSDIITSGSLPEAFLHPAGVPASAAMDGFDLPPEGLDLEAYLEWLGKRLMQQALERTNGVQIRAAELLRMTERSFRYYAKKYGLRREEEEVYEDAGLPLDEG
ncbi:MAG TPA: sigma-54 dependent transcriptional regulator [Thermoanaerobaculia bacterium]|nr:sigma-54 dependent transcriptional regulator [Thermoanaerobaculia bacterium]